MNNMIIEIPPRVYIVVDKVREKVQLVANCANSEHIINKLHGYPFTTGIGYVCVFVPENVMDEISEMVK